MGGRKADYPALEREFITSPERISLRALAERVGISNSTISDYAREHKWEEKREAHIAEVERRFLSAAAESRARQLSRIADQTITMLEMTITRAAIQLAGDEESGKAPMDVTLKDALDAARMVSALRGQATEITEERQIVGHLADPRLLGLLGDLAERRLRSDGSGGETVRALPEPVERSA